MQRYICRSLPVAFLILASAMSMSAQEKRGVIPEDYYRMVAVSDVTLSPGADLVAFTVTTAVEEENRRHREVWLQSLREGQPVGEPYRFTSPTEESSAPRWAPDGDVLSFQSTRGKKLEATWFARVTAPGGEAYQIPGVKGAPVWSPDGEWIAFAWAPKRDPEAEGAAAREGWISPDAITRTLDSERFDGRVINYLHYKSDGESEFLPHPATIAREAALRGPGRRRRGPAAHGFLV